MIVIIYETLSDQLSYVEDMFSLIWLKSLLSVILLFPLYFENTLMVWYCFIYYFIANNFISNNIKFQKV
jgi:hypothetical protein